MAFAVASLLAKDFGAGDDCGVISKIVIATSVEKFGVALIHPLYECLLWASP
jgi:hypothetical protein